MLRMLLNLLTNPDWFVPNLEQADLELESATEEDGMVTTVSVYKLPSGGTITISKSIPIPTKRDRLQTELDKAVLVEDYLKAAELKKQIDEYDKKEMAKEK